MGGAREDRVRVALVSPTDLYPLGLRIAGRDTLVVGGGPVAARRTAGLVAAGALVTVVAPELCRELAALAGNGAVTWRDGAYRSADLHGIWLVHTATGVPAVDSLVSTDAAAARVWCVNASDHEVATAWVPAVSRRDDITVAVSAGGDPRRAMALRDAIGSALDDGALPTRRHRRRAHEASRAGHPLHTAPDAPAEVPSGSVALVGGGPGDPELITVRGLRLLAHA
ncbi:MAG: uroporphyrinogen-III C-methyltransferase, partial [Actinomycetota bacterium]